MPVNDPLEIMPYVKTKVNDPLEIMPYVKTKTTLQSPLAGLESTLPAGGIFPTVSAVAESVVKRNGGAGGSYAESPQQLQTGLQEKRDYNIPPPSGIPNIPLSGNYQPQPVNPQSNVYSDIFFGGLKGGSLGYAGPPRYEPRHPGIYNAAELAGSLPIMAAGGGALGKVIKSARPIAGFARAGLSGLGYGAAKKPEEGESRTVNAVKDALTFMAFHTPGVVFPKDILSRVAATAGVGGGLGAISGGTSEDVLYGGTVGAIFGILGGRGKSKSESKSKPLPPESYNKYLEEQAKRAEVKLSESERAERMAAYRDLFDLAETYYQQSHNEYYPVTVPGGKEPLKSAVEKFGYYPKGIPEQPQFIPTPELADLPPAKATKPIKMAKPVEVSAEVLKDYPDLAKQQGEVELGSGVDPFEAVKRLFPNKFQKGKLKERGFVTSVKKRFPNLEKVEGQYIPRATDPLAIKARTLIKENFNSAEEIAFKRTDDFSVAMTSELLKYYSDLAANAPDVAIKNSLYEKSAKLANAKAVQLTELGRAVQAASILSRTTPEGKLRFAAREIQKYNAKVRPGKKIPELTGEQSQYITEEMKTVVLMPEGVEKAMRMQKLNNYISDLTPTPLMRKIIAVWKAGLLTGLKTTGLNINSTLFHLGSEIAKDIPASVVDKTVELFTGKRTVTTNFSGLGTGTREGIGRGWQYLKTGFDERNIGTKLDYRRVNFGKGRLAKALQVYTNIPFRALGAQDQPFFYAARLWSLYEQAKAEAINFDLQGKEAQKFIDDLVQNPTDKMLKYSQIDAETVVFQNETVLGKVARSIQNIGNGAGEIIVPFGRTPSAVAMQIVNYSPVGIVKTIFENAGRGRFDQRLFSQGMGRGLTGVGVVALGAYLYKKGLITTAYPTGERERKLWELEGRQKNSVKLSGKWRQLPVLGPAGNVLSLGSSFQKAFNNTGSPTEAMTVALAEATQSFTQQTFLTGVSNIVEAMTAPARSAKGVVSSTLASTIPTIVSDIAKATDSKERRSEQIFDYFKSRVPGARETLEPQVDILGQERGIENNPLTTMADPTRPTTEVHSPITDELRRLWDKGLKVSPTLLGDKAGFKGLTPEENTSLWKSVGQAIEKHLNQSIKSLEYQNASDEEKAKFIDQVVDFYQSPARDYAKAKYIFSEAEKLGTVAEKKAYLDKLWNKKVITPKVGEQIQALIGGNTEKGTK